MKPGKTKQEKPSGWLPEGCDDPDLYNWIKSEKCMCGGHKIAFVTFCRDCYMALPSKLRLELWRPWKDEFSSYYSECIDYLEKETTRFTCQKGNTSSSRTSTLSSGKAKSVRSGAHSQITDKPKSACAPETLPLLDYLQSQPGSICSDSSTDSSEPSSSPVTTNTTAPIQRKRIVPWPF